MAIGAMEVEYQNTAEVVLEAQREIRISPEAESTRLQIEHMGQILAALTTKVEELSSMSQLREVSQFQPGENHGMFQQGQNMYPTNS